MKKKALNFIFLNVIYRVSHVMQFNCHIIAEQTLNIVELIYLLTIFSSNISFVDYPLDDNNPILTLVSLLKLSKQ